MKKSILLIPITVFSSFFAFAQFDVSLKLQDNTIVTNGTLSKSGPPEDLIQEYITATNNGTNTLHMKVKKQYINVISGTEDLFCWKACYSASTFVSPDTIWLNPDRSSFLLTVDYKDKGFTGTSIIKYVFFDEAFPNDSVYVTINFSTSGVGINELDEKQNTISNAYPNPAKVNTNFNYSLSENVNNAEISIYNILGKVVKNMDLNTNENKISVSLDGLEKGVYFYSFIVDGKKIVTKRLVISDN